jgi:predicted lipoprotein with Yx(FWY)xxD motif
MARDARWGTAWRLLAVLAAIAVAVVVIVVVSDDKSSGGQRHPASPAASVRVAKTHLGSILVDDAGRTLYLYTRDKGATSACHGVCAKVWPPALVRGAPVAGPGVARAKLSVTGRAGSTQLVYAGHPLYRALGDTRPGQTNGEGLFGVWYVLSPSGRAIIRRGAIGGGGY